MLGRYSTATSSDARGIARQAEQQKSSLRQKADIAITPLQDAVDLDMAANAEKSTLTEWCKYRVLFNRMDCYTTLDTSWPELPNWL